MKKSQKAVKSNRGRKPFPRHDLSGFSPVEVAEIYGLELATICAWGCPKDEKTGLMHLKDVIQWRDEKLQAKPVERVELENQKLTLQCEKMTIEIEKMKAEYIPLSTHQQIMASRARSLTNYWNDAWKLNLHLFCHKSIDQLRPLADRFVMEACNHYANNHK
jgi:hypothetical protein